ncbi:MAG: aminodeoxychorismate synthase component I [Parvibaculum sp.]|uniref:aminodeoxychorismate synthase component I n=1 Tax=Parvibaculum sp. TaxID=2024848 RepID=UPI0025E71A52|nr:aminodeoxychorismate synthase component I [Parvibaculum sp.]MCE9648596.1 aminodeoxychorismate synthase component I [Parvibaculum sp.]
MSELLIEELAWVEPHELFHAFAHEPYALLLDSATAGPGRDTALHGRWSFIARDPFETLTSRSGDTACPFAALKAKLADMRSSPSDESLPPFTGGAAGFFGYDLARRLERLPAEGPPCALDDQNLPELALGFYDTVVAFDMTTRRALLLSSGQPERDPRKRISRARDRATDLRARIAAAVRPRAATASRSDIGSNFTRAAYELAVARIVEYIRAGDIFQANLSQRFEARLGKDDTPYDLYLRLRAQSPAPFASFFNFGSGALVSSSPERFLLCRNGEVETKPIKGTRPRGHTPSQDARLAAELLASEKDRAENVMIVDLLRNDLSRVCADHTVVVEKLCALESFANVHHLVSTVRGRLSDGETAVDLLTAAFPGGSITGAPKLRAMEIIAELEPTTRGPYCGAIGYLGFDGAMDTSIAIRTMTVKGERVTFQAGGGVTADSEPAAEYEETLAKAKAMIRALGGKAHADMRQSEEAPA